MLYDPEDPRHLEYLRRALARWTPEKEAALQRKFAQADAAKVTR